MQSGANLQKVIEWSKYLQAQTEGKDEMKEMYQEARDFLEFYDWCGEILDTYVGMLYIGIVGVFLFRIAPTREDVDEWIWVVVGDVPPAYLTVDECPNPATALDGYIGAMQKWVEAAREERSVANLIPVNVPATKDNADMLISRLNFLNENILSEYEEDLKA